MRVGVYIDGFNVFYGGRAVCGRGAAGWRWLDLRSLAQTMLPREWRSAGAHIARVIYCTARVSGAVDPTSPRDQDVYLRALRRTGVVDDIVMGTFVSRVRTAPLATSSPKGKPVIVGADWPVKIRDANQVDVPDAWFMVSYAHREEKGSDVNVASHLLVDVLTESIDAAIVISNDGDLEYPVAFARRHVPVGVVNPGKRPVAGKLKAVQSVGVGRHWWAPITADLYHAHQLADAIDHLHKPNGW